MKTLDEVIKAWSICFSDNSRSDCTGCPYADEDGEAACFNHDREDALQYLKTYRENQQTYIENSRKAEEARERYLEAVKNCELAENKYRKLYEETSQNLRNTSQITCPKCHSEFVILPDANNPLSWDELQQMEGKPVWIDSVPLVRRWVIIKKFHPIGGNHNPFDMEVEDGAHFLRKSMGRDTGAWWQAYRKERTDGLSA